MTDKKIDLADLQKSIEALRQIQKGHNSRGTNTTAVETMQNANAGAGSSAGATQVYHTPSNSDPGTWAGTSNDKVANDGAGDSIDANGTDLNGVLGKVAKGQTLSAAEFAILEKAAKKGFLDKLKDDEGDDEEDDKSDAPPAFKAKKSKDKDKDVEKSLADLAEEDEATAKGLEVSEFLSNFVQQISKSLELTEARINRNVDARISALQANAETVNKSFAEVLTHVGSVAAYTAQRMDQVETGPARAPLAAQNVDVIEKSAPAPEKLNKSMVLATLEDLVVKGQIDPREVIKFETTGQLSPSLKEKVVHARSNA